MAGGVADGGAGFGAAAGEDVAGAGGAGATGLAAAGAGVALGAGGACGLGGAAAGVGGWGCVAGAEAAGFAATGAVGAGAATGGLAMGFGGSAGGATAGDAGSGSAVPCNWRRTLSAISTGIELEWVFFSVTPNPGKRSMIAFALTSNSRASSLMRTCVGSLMRCYEFFSSC